MIRRAARAGYTLLEMTLALAIALVILGAVYEFLNRQVFMADAGREIVEEGALARALLDRIAGDVASSLGGVDPQQLPGVSADATEALLQAETFVPLFNNGLEGSSGLIVLSVSRAPRELLAPNRRRVDASNLPRVSDLRRISYWYDEEYGLMRQEITRVTGEEMGSLPPDVADPLACVLAPEVKGVTFEYFDGANWQASWSGNAYAADGTTPVGPPAAVRVSLSIRSRDGQTVREYRHTVALPAGNNFLAQQLGF